MITSQAKWGCLHIIVSPYIQILVTFSYYFNSTTMASLHCDLKIVESTFWHVFGKVCLLNDLAWIQFTKYSCAFCKRPLNICQFLPGKVNENFKSAG